MFNQRSKSTATRHHSSSGYPSNPTPNQWKPMNRLAGMPSMTYSALPKAREPPVNSVEYYQMQMQQHGAQGFSNIQQAAAPAHIQHASANSGVSNESFYTGSPFDPFPSSPNDVNRRAQQAQAATKPAGNTLTSLRDQYMYQAKESLQNELPSQSVQQISRTIVGEDTYQQKAPTSKVYQPAGSQPAAAQPEQVQNETQEQDEQMSPDELVQMATDASN
jgi:hypothetical protein